MKRVAISNFKVYDPLGWIARAKNYFEEHNVGAELKIVILYCSGVN